MKGRTAAVPLAVACVIAAGCGTTTIDTAQAEHTIKAGVQGVTGKKVTASCPSDIPAEKGRVTMCTVTAADGTKATVRMVQTNNSGHVDFTSPVVHTTQLEQQIASSASRQLGFPVTIICPDLVEAATGKQFQCKATDQNGKSAPVYVTAQSAHGGFNYHLGRAAASTA